MPYSTDTARILAEPLVDAFFRDSEGDWRSERRYYTLKSGETQTVVSHIQVRYLSAGSNPLVQLAELHGLQGQDAEAHLLVCGACVEWESNYVDNSRKPTQGSTVFGVRGSVLYRDRGFATSDPVTAQFQFTDPRTMTLYTAYQDSSFEEEIRLVGQRYRTRQTIICRAGEEIMIGQYLETRI